MIMILFYDMMQDFETVDIVKAMLDYSKKLENMVMELREQVNSLTPKGQPIPFREVKRDFLEAFFECPAYKKNQYFYKHEEKL